MNKENRKIAFEHAVSNMPNESCGLVIIEKGFEVFVPCRNQSPFKGAFVIHPEDFAKAEDRGTVVRIVHSHVYSSAEPSEVDKVSCEASKLPWSIVSVPNGVWKDIEPTGFKSPLVGRSWAHGLQDCYSLIRDYYDQRLDIQIPDFEREFEWWMAGQNLYAENFVYAGFREVPIEAIKEHDVILMRIMSPVINHGAVYIGGDQMLHHLHRRLSCRDVFGGYYRKHAVKVVRHASR